MSDRHGYHRSVVACYVFSPLTPFSLAIGVLLCRLRPQPQLNFRGGGVKPVKVKRRRGDHKQSEREEGRSGVQMRDLLLQMLWFVPLM